MKQTVILLIILFTIISCSPKLQPGLYGTNFNTYGMFATTLQLNCDSTFVKRFQGDLIDDKSYGNWYLEADTLVLQFDITNSKARYQGIERYIYRNKKLISPISKDALKKLKIILDTMPTQHRKNIKKMLRRGSTPKDFKGNMGHQYLELKEKRKCKRQS